MVSSNFEMGRPDDRFLGSIFFECRATVLFCLLQKLVRLDCLPGAQLPEGSLALWHAGQSVPEEGALQGPLDRRLEGNALRRPWLRQAF